MRNTEGSIFSQGHFLSPESDQAGVEAGLSGPEYTVFRSFPAIIYQPEILMCVGMINHHK
jgi:hypothetical protein